MTREMAIKLVEMDTPEQAADRLVELYEAIDELCRERDWLFDRLSELEETNALFVDALRAGYMLHNGIACIRSEDDIPMTLTGVSESIVRRALESIGGEV